MAMKIFDKNLLWLALFAYIFLMLVNTYVMPLIPAGISGIGLLGLSLGGYIGMLLTLYIAGLVKNKVVK